MRARMQPGAMQCILHACMHAAFSHAMHPACVIAHVHRQSYASSSRQFLWQTFHNFIHDSRPNKLLGALSYKVLCKPSKWGLQRQVWTRCASAPSSQRLGQGPNVAPGPGHPRPIVPSSIEAGRIDLGLSQALLARIRASRSGDQLCHVLGASSLQLHRAVL